VEIDDIAGQFERVGAKTECPVCEHERWGISPTPFVLTPVEDGRIEGSRGAVVRAITCANCGFVRLHNPDAFPTDAG
jgi:rubredoxin